MSAFDQVKESIMKWWFFLSALALAFLYFTIDRRNRTINQLQADAQRQILAQKLLTLREKSQGSENEQKQAMEDYTTLKLRHADLLAKWGVFTGGNVTPLKQYAAKPDTSGNSDSNPAP